MNTKPRIVSGIQPTGDLHVGNYLGAIKNFVELQNSGKYDCFFFIADLHSLSEDYDPKQKKEEIHKLVATLKALGLDENKSTIFLQSHVQGHTELAWLFSTVIPVGELERMTQFKDKAARQKKNINAALLTYPILQTADVLLYNGQLVPVGKDQEQHIELIRVIAKKMNSKFGTDFPASKPLFTNVPKVMSLRDPSKKMSKSLGDAHVLNIFDDPETVRKKIQKAVTATDINASPDAQGFMLLMAHFHVEQGGQFSEMKKSFAETFITFFEKPKQEYERLMQNTSELDTVLEKGRKKAQPIAAKTLSNTKQKMGLL